MKDKVNNENLENDEFEVVEEENAGEANFLTKYGKLLIIGAAIIVVALGSFYYFSYTNEKAMEESSVALSRVRPYFDQGEFAKALAGGDVLPPVLGKKVLGLKEIANKYGSQPAGQLAALLAGEALVNLEKYSEAVKYFETASDSESDVVKKGAYAGLGVCFEADNKLEKAVENYEKAVEFALEPGSKARYMFYSGLCYEKMGTKDKAEQIYRELVNDRDYLEFANMAKAGLVRLGTVIE